MGCLKLIYYQTEPQLKLVYRNTEPQKKTVQSWLSVDPKSDDYPSMSPYMFVEGNPIILTDPDGMSAVGPDEWDVCIMQDGTVETTWKSDKGGSNKQIVNVSYENGSGDHISTGESIVADVSKNEFEWGANKINDVLDKAQQIDQIAEGTVDGSYSSELVLVGSIRYSRTQQIVYEFLAVIAASEPTLAGEVILTGTAVGFSIYNIASDSKPNEKHGDNGRAIGKAKGQVEDLERQLANAKTHREKVKIKNKIRNVQRSAQGKKDGEEHSRTIKR